MESAQALKLAAQMERQGLLSIWLESNAGVHPILLEPMPGDASLRRYFRVNIRGESFVVMDAPPEYENCRPFVAIAKALCEIGLYAPDILEADVERGFLLLTDFGDQTFLNTLNINNADILYRKALEALALLQTCRFVDGHTIPPFTADFMLKEWAWHKEWFLEKWLGIDYRAQEKELDACYQLLVESAVNQPQVFMHRDYHSANLMVLPENEVGILDFQDAFIGPVTYDAVSLLRDCYIDWPEESVQIWSRFYRQKLLESETIDFFDEAQWQRWFDFMGMQRHLKALLTFARKQVRDQQPRYLQFVPRTLNYLVRVSANYPELTVLHQFLRNTVRPAVQQVML